MIPVGKTELKKAYNYHYRNYEKMCKNQEDGYSRQLLLFYAVECCLKYIWLEQNRKQKIDSKDDYGLKTHDINRLQKYCKLPNISSHTIPRIRTSSGEIAECSQFHEICRYSINVIDKTDIQKIETILENIYKDAENYILKLR